MLKKKKKKKKKKIHFYFSFSYFHFSKLYSNKWLGLTMQKVYFFNIFIGFKILASSIMCFNWLISLKGRVFANGLGDLGSIPGRIIPKTLKMVLDTALLNTQHYKVCIKGKVE